MTRLMPPATNRSQLKQRSAKLPPRAGRDSQSTALERSRSRQDGHRLQETSLPTWGCRKTGKIWPLAAKTQEQGDVLSTEQAGRAAGRGAQHHCTHLAGAFQGFFGGVIFLWLEIGSICCFFPIWGARWMERRELDKQTDQPGEAGSSRQRQQDRNVPAWGHSPWSPPSPQPGRGVTAQHTAKGHRAA